MNELARALAERIRAEGPLSFAEYMRVALYDPERGYYRAGGERTGWRGHFVTSPEIDPAFGALWARAFDEIWRLLDRPERFVVVEVGPGEGGFALSLLKSSGAEFLQALDLRLVEIDPERRRRQERLLSSAPTAKAVSWTESVDEMDSFPHGIVFANEVLDNQPVHVLRNRAGGLQELHVGVDDGRLAEVWLDCADDGLIERALASDRPAGVEVEISPAAEDLAFRCAQLPQSGAAVFVDYGLEPGAEDRARATLASYSAAGAGNRTLLEPGTADLTAHVDWAAVGAACAQEAGVATYGPLEQRRVLLDLGARVFDERLRDEHGVHLQAGRGAEAVKALSRRQALRAILDPGGLGGLHVFVAARNLDAPAWFQK